MIVPIIIHQEKEPEPRCPHCDRELKGWQEPVSDDLPLWGKLTVLALCILLLVNLIGGLFGFLDGSMARWKVCRWPETKGSYVVPAYYFGCEIGSWISEPTGH